MFENQNCFNTRQRFFTGEKCHRTTNTYSTHCLSRMDTTLKRGGCTSFRCKAWNAKMWGIIPANPSRWDTRITYDPPPVSPALFQCLGDRYMVG